MATFNKVGILVRDEEQPFPIEELSREFSKHGVEAMLLDQGDEPPGVDLVMAMGGDGTVLRALDRFPDCPVLAINFGTVGFLTAGDRKDLKQIVQRLIEGRYLASERLLLDCEFDGERHQAINEIELRALSRLVFIDVHVNDTEIRTIRGDGVVIGTPTGSTGFLLSTGAPIVMPDVRCLILDGINEHNFTSRALILTPESRIRLHISDETKASEVYLIIDGNQICNLEPGREVHINQAKRTAKLIYFEDNYFFHNLTSKLSW